MKFIHPIFMLLFMYCLYYQYKLGKNLLAMQLRHGISELEREAAKSKHKVMGWILIAFCIVGFILGIVMTTRVYPEITEPFGWTYGHGYIGTLVLASLIISFILGLSIKTVVKPKIRERFIGFHKNLLYIVVFFSALALLSGAGLLIMGPSQPTVEIQKVP